jgi:hypothetical protein
MREVFSDAVFWGLGFALLVIYDKNRFHASI